MSVVALPARGACKEMMRDSGACRRVGASAMACGRKKRARETAPAREAFDVRKEVFAVGEMSGKERSFFRKRLQRELVAVRGVLKKLAVVPEPEAVEGAAPSSSPPAAAPRGKDGRFEESIEADKNKTAKRRKTSPPLPPPAVHIEAPAPPKMTPAEREQLAFSLAALSAELCPDTATLLQKESHGRRGEVVVDANSMGDAALFELKKQLDKFFVKTKRDPPSMAQDDGKIVDDEGKTGLERADVFGGVSHSPRTPSPPRQLEILDQCGDIFAATRVDKPLSPLPQKYLALAEKVVPEEEEEEYVDICGDASPVVILQNPGPTPIISRSTSTSSSSDSDSDSDGSDSSDSFSGSDSCPAAPAVTPEVNGESGRRPSEPAPEAAQAEPAEKVSSPPAPAQEVVQNAAEPEKASSPSAPGVHPLPKANNGDSEALPSEPAKEVTQNAEAEKMSNSPAPALPLPKANGDSAKQLDAAQQNAEQEIKLPVDPQSAAAPAGARSMSELIAEAQEKRWREETSRAREKARQELAETERSAMASDRVHPLDMEELGIAQVEHIVSDIAQQQTLLYGVRPGLLQKLGLFLKPDDDDDGGDGEQQQQTSSVPGDDDLEEGEIR